MTKTKTSAKPKAKQGKKATTTLADAGAVEATTAETLNVTPVATASTETVSTTATRRAGRMNRQQAKALSLEEEYSYVVKDLRRVFILAAIMFAGLIAVNLAFSLLGG